MSEDHTVVITPDNPTHLYIQLQDNLEKRPPFWCDITRAKNVKHSCRLKLYTSYKILNDYGFGEYMDYEVGTKMLARDWELLDFLVEVHSVLGDYLWKLYLIWADYNYPHYDPVVSMSPLPKAQHFFKHWVGVFRDKKDIVAHLLDLSPDALILEYCELDSLLSDIGVTMIACPPECRPETERSGDFEIVFSKELRND